MIAGGREAVCQIDRLIAGFDFAVELGVAERLEDRPEVGSGAESELLLQVVACQQRWRLELVGRRSHGVSDETDRVVGDFGGIEFGESRGGAGFGDVDDGIGVSTDEHRLDLGPRAATRFGDGLPIPNGGGDGPAFAVGEPPPFADLIETGEGIVAGEKDDREGKGERIGAAEIRGWAVGQEVRGER